MNSCNICVENYNRSTRSLVVCDYCQFECCKECIKKYLLSITEDSHCMSCKKKWDRKILSKKMDKTFMSKTYKSYREQILFEREKSLLPSTQPHIEKIIQIQKMDDEIWNIRTQMDELKKKLTLLHNEKSFLENSRGNQERKQFIRPCSNKDCKGFLSTQWKCGLCEKFTCRNCLEVKEENEEEKIIHECKPDNVSTAQLILKDTKNCPKCGVSIFKISGCSQIWCTNCHTAFSWDTGRIENGNIHNPHYFEWLNRNGGNINRNPEEVRCGREIDHFFISDLSRMTRSSHFIFINLDEQREIKRELLENLRNIIHMREVDIPRFRVNDIEDNLKIRIDYMRDKITEDDFKIKIQRKEKEYQKKKEIYDILRMFIDCFTEIMYRLYDFMFNNHRHNPEILDEVSKLIDYVNNCFEDISKTYNCRCYKIDKDTYELK